MYYIVILLSVFLIGLVSYYNDFLNSDILIVFLHHTIEIKVFVIFTLIIVLIALLLIFFTICKKLLYFSDQLFGVSNNLHVDLHSSLLSAGDFNTKGFISLVVDNFLLKKNINPKKYFAKVIARLNEEEVLSILVLKFLHNIREDDFVCKYCDIIADTFPRKKFSIYARAESAFRYSKCRQALPMLLYLAKEKSISALLDNVLKMTQKCYCVIADDYIENNNYSDALIALNSAFKYSTSVSSDLIYKKVNILFHLLKFRKLRKFVEENLSNVNCTQIFDKYLATYVSVNKKLDSLSMLISLYPDNKTLLFVYIRELIKEKKYSAVSDFLIFREDLLKNRDIFALYVVALVETGDRLRCIRVTQDFIEGLNQLKDSETL